MTVTEATVRGYEQLADLHEGRREVRQRDLFLVLAADAAFRLGQRDRAERLRQRLLAANPHHLFKPFASVADALHSPDIERFVQDLRRQYPPETVEPPAGGQKTPPAAGEAGPAAAPSGPPAPSPPAKPAKQEPAPPRPEFKVLWHKDSAPLSRPPSPPLPPTPSSPTAPFSPASASAARAPKPPTRSREIQSPYGGPVESRRADAADDADGGWIAVTVFGLCLLGFVALAGYALVRPLLENW